VETYCIIGVPDSVYYITTSRWEIKESSVDPYHSKMDLTLVGTAGADRKAGGSI
jgi:hypothetical protein